MTTAAVATPTPNVLVVLEHKVEVFIQEVVAGVKHEVQVIEQALSNAAPLVAAAASKIESLAPFVESLGAAAGHPEVIAGVEAANVAMAGLNSFVQTFAKATTGGGVTATEAKDAINGVYTAYRNTISTYNAVKATAVAVVTRPSAPTPVVTAAAPAPAA